MSRIENLKEEDAALVEALEREIFGTPWSENTVLVTIQNAETSRKKQEETGEVQPFSYGAFGVREVGELLGYLFSMAVAGEGELHRIAVSPKYRRKGIADTLMNGFFSWLVSQKADAATLEVRAGNAAAVALYEKYGFKEEGRRKEYYRNPVEDALIFWCRQFPL